ncbi:MULTISPECIES: hypothetical protein [unclassified Fusibacter]|uniref:hypothetical protein n=1 Tax=unclassified Fusibacter TaxID=2624464 RepID=UPI0013E91D5F|nr:MULTISPECIES: hypothetical protein [unclassified Fusibacter]MCK8058556.1 hypothetical protein [Fusibacter sp. A2]NPE22675.1 hypothetical protein [Fusibacter sp. A1]
MLIRWVKNEDKPAWMQLVGTVAELFNSSNMATDETFHSYMDHKVERFEALTAIDRMTGRCLGVIDFSRANNRISWFAVQPDLRVEKLQGLFMKKLILSIVGSLRMNRETYAVR